MNGVVLDLPMVHGVAVSTLVHALRRNRQIMLYLRNHHMIDGFLEQLLNEKLPLEQIQYTFFKEGDEATGGENWEIPCKIVNGKLYKAPNVKYSRTTGGCLITVFRRLANGALRQLDFLSDPYDITREAMSQKRGMEDWGDIGWMPAPTEDDYVAFAEYADDTIDQHSMAEKGSGPMVSDHVLQKEGQEELEIETNTKFTEIHHVKVTPRAGVQTDDCPIQWPVVRAH